MWINFINQLGLIRRLPGWPGQELQELLISYKTPFFYPECNGGADTIRRLSDATVASQFSGSFCGKCHVVS